MEQNIFLIANIGNIIVSIAYLVLTVFSVYIFFRFYDTLKHIRIACQLYVAQNLRIMEKAKQMREQFDDMSIHDIANILDVDVSIVQHWLEFEEEK
ncbi:hypothetical protein C6499_04530 [Candidatus Poribacteria bacterium]|nr:MAG: hypothetical protein C6499_04530 [Candidatus Poribacteria bacterium]